METSSSFPNSEQPADSVSTADPEGANPNSESKNEAELTSMEVQSVRICFIISALAGILSKSQDFNFIQ